MQPIRLAGLESFYIGGHTRDVDSTAFGPETQVSGAMYVQRMLPLERSFPHPVIFIHGGMHTGVTWETTPDGREGWQLEFVRGGFEAVVIDQAWRGRSAPDLTALNPMIASAEAVGPAFTCGLRMGERFERGGGRFPTQALRTYGAQLWPDFGVPAALAAGLPGLSDSRALPPLLELIDRLGRVVLLTHSQGGDLGWKAALARPQQVAGILSVEPALTVPGLDNPGFPDIPVCLMWGDNLPAEAPTLSLLDIEAARAVMKRRPRVQLDWLPQHGIRGNGHMLMMENNSAELAVRAMNWFRTQISAKD